MAEGVQFQLERQLPELEQMVHCGLFTKPETSAIVRKRKQFEYKVHRHSKSKQDYLQYIEYESALLALLRKRREKEGYSFRKKEIDHAILNRIHSLFRAATKRFQGDVSLWLTYIEFCKEKRNQAMVSRTFSDMLAIHSKDPALWILAAQWELEANKDAETARSLLQRGLRFLGESTTLWKEYLRMELIHVERMRKRMLALTAESSAEDAVADAAADPVLGGQIVGVVYRQAVAAMPESPDLLFELLEIGKSFADILPDLEVWIYDDLKLNFSSHARAWDKLARRHIEHGGKKKTAPSSIIGGDEDVDVERRRVAEVENCEKTALRVFEEGLKTVEDSPSSVASLFSSSSSSSSTNLWKLACLFAVETLFRGASTEPTLTESRLETAVDLLKRTETAERMDEQLYLDWIRILRNFDFDDANRDFGFPAILARALTKFPTSLSLWTIRLQKAINDSAIDGFTAAETILDQAVAKVNEKETWNLWEVYLDWKTQTCDDKGEIEAAFKRASTTTGRERSKAAKEAYLKFVVENGKDETDIQKKILGVYDSLKTHRPHSADYYRFVIDRLTDERTKRRVFLDAVDELGKTEVDLWLEYERFETEVGGKDVGLIYKRALRELDSDLVPKYETQHVLTVTGHLGSR